MTAWWPQDIYGTLDTSRRSSEGCYTLADDPSSTLFYPKQGGNAFYAKLRKQCENLSIPQVGASDDSASAFRSALSDSDVVMDAIFGFSFKGEPRAPFDTVLQDLIHTDKPILSVDIPSGWEVEKGDPEGKYFTPDVLVSLTAPKLGCREFKGIHYLGGRCVGY